MCFVGEVPEDEMGEEEKQRGALRMRIPPFLQPPPHMGPTSWGYLAPVGLTVPTPCQVRPLLPSTHFCTHTHPRGPRKVKVGQDRVVAHSMGNSAGMLVSIQVLGAPLCLEMVICCGLAQWIYGKGRSLAYLPTLAGAQLINPVPGWSGEPAVVRPEWTQFSWVARDPPGAWRVCAHPKSTRRKEHSFRSLLCLERDSSFQQSWIWMAFVFSGRFEAPSRDKPWKTIV